MRVVDGRRLLDDLQFLCGAEQLHVLLENLLSVDEHREARRALIFDFCADSSETGTRRQHLAVSRQHIADINTIPTIKQDLLVDRVDLLRVNRSHN